MKILHTADWHIGKQLHKFYLDREFDLFVDWLCEVIQKESIDLVLISGDIFDLANPSAEARKQYYHSLIKIHQLGCRIIITGGNHDSIHMLNAPKEVLSHLNIDVIGGLPAQLEDAIIPITSGDKIELVICAVPFLRDADLRKSMTSQSYDDKLELVRQGITSIYQHLAEICRDKYPSIHCIAMGHLYAAGVETSDSERDIQVGNQALVQASSFGDYFDYVALGHIHKPQKVSGPIPIYYSGSPLPLSFSERKDNKRILILDSKNSFEPVSVDVPKFRNLIKIAGTLEDIQNHLQQLKEETALVSLIEIQLLEEDYNVEKIFQLDQLIQDFDQAGYEIVHRTISFQNQLRGTADIYEETQSLEELHPKDVFLKMIDNHNYDDSTKEGLLMSFQELLEEVYHEESTAS